MVKSILRKLFFFLFFGIFAVEGEWTVPDKCMPKEGPASIILPNSKLDIVGEAIFGVDYFQGVPGSNSDGSAGAFLGSNLVLSIPNDLCYSFGIQLGGSYGLYDSAKTSVFRRGTDEQTFLTGGIFLNTASDAGFHAAVVYDWMHYGVTNLSKHHMNLLQVRYLASYLTCCSDEIGIWGTVHTNTSTKYDISFRAVDQVSLFWRHLFVNCCEAKIWAGVPFGDDDHFSRHGKFILGGNFWVPLPCNWSVGGQGMYMQAYQCDRSCQSNAYAFDLCISINYSFGCSPCCSEDTCSYRTYLPIGNNSNFVIDTSGSSFKG